VAPHEPSQESRPSHAAVARSLDEERTLRDNAGVADARQLQTTARMKVI